jgi:methionine-rich copper-binding protein CopC
MDRRELIAAIASVAAVAQAPQALARFRGGAILDHAVPGVGLTVSGPVHEVRLYFDLGVIAAWSSVQVVNAAGAAVVASPPVNDPSDQQILVVRLKRALPRGTYKVSWHAVSIHERPTSGTFRFTVS